MAKLKINLDYRPPASPPTESVFDRNRRLGAKLIRTTGRIGNGTKVHHLTLEVVETDNGLGLLSVWSLCGGAKWNSLLIPHFDDELECTCKRCGANAYRSNDYNCKGEKTMKTTVTVKQLKTACDLINEQGELRPDNDPIRFGAKATKAEITTVFLAALDEISKADKLDNVPADAWDTYRILVPKGSEQKESTGVNYDDIPEAKDVKKAAKEAAKAIKDTGMAPNKTTKPNGETKVKFTKAMAFWKCLTDNPVTDKKALAEMLRTNHGNGSEAEAKFWTNNYLNLLVETGLVEVKGQAVTLIER
jgi:hypothetical protein